MASGRFPSRTTSWPARQTLIAKMTVPSAANREANPPLENEYGHLATLGREAKHTLMVVPSNGWRELIKTHFRYGLYDLSRLTQNVSTHPPGYLPSTSSVLYRHCKTQRYAFDMAVKYRLTAKPNLRRAGKLKGRLETITLITESEI